MCPKPKKALTGVKAKISVKETTASFGKKKKPNKVLAAASRPETRSRHMPMPNPSATAGSTKSRTEVKKEVATTKSKLRLKNKVRTKGPVDQRESVREHLTLSHQTWKSMRGLQSAGESSVGGVKGRLTMMIVGLSDLVFN